MTSNSRSKLDAAEMYGLWLRHRQQMDYDRKLNLKRSAAQQYRIAINFWRLYLDAKGVDYGCVE
jgi:hypothetical protein